MLHFTWISVSLTKSFFTYFRGFPLRPLELGAKRSLFGVTTSLSISATGYQVDYEIADRVSYYGNAFKREITGLS